MSSFGNQSRHGIRLLPEFFLPTISTFPFRLPAYSCTTRFPASYMRSGHPINLTFMSFPSSLVRFTKSSQLCPCSYWFFADSGATISISPALSSLPSHFLYYPVKRPLHLGRTWHPLCNTAANYPGIPVWNHLRHPLRTLQATCLVTSSPSCSKTHPGYDYETLSPHSLGSRRSACSQSNCRCNRSVSSESSFTVSLYARGFHQ